MPIIRLQEAWRRGWVGAIRLALYRDRDFLVDLEVLAEVLAGIKRIDDKYQDDDVIMMIMGRLAQRNIRPGFGSRAEEYGSDNVATARMHVFFLNCEETPEMLAILANDPEAIKRRDEARSRLFRDFWRGITPIDRTANRVTRVLPTV